ncbi:hypothetical protein [Tenacibaculum sp. SDUM215027]|uniref:hypothetical protein n=1 Tax=Tenacibaculum sp. SDUM215027 TaxID=3422596 RepID=UPI003D31E2CB
MIDYQIVLEKLLPPCRPKSYWIVTWIDDFFYRNGNVYTNIELVNSSTSYFRVNHFNKELRVNLTIPIHYLMDISIGSVFNSKGKLIPQSISNYDSFNWRYKKTTSNFSIKDNIFPILTLLKDFYYPLPNISSKDNFRYYALKIPYLKTYNKFIKEKFYIVLIPEIVLTKFFFFEKNSVDGINAMVNGHFTEDIIKKRYIIKKDGIRTGYIRYDNNVLPEQSIRKLVNLLFLKSDQGIKAIKELNSSLYVNNQIAKRLPFNSNMNISLYGRYLGKKSSNKEGVLNIFMAFGINSLDIEDRSIFTVDRYDITKDIETNTTDSADKAPREKYTSLLQRNRNKSKNQSIKNNSRVKSSRESEIIKDNTFSSFGVDLPIFIRKRTEQDKKWEMQDQKLIIHDTDSITGDSDICQDSTSSGRNYARQNIAPKVIDRSFNFFNKVASTLAKEGISGKYLKINNRNSFYNRITFCNKNFWYLIFEIEYKEKYFYLIRLDPSLTSYIPLLNESNLRKIELNDLRLILIKFANSNFDMRKIKSKKLLKKINTELHNFNHRVKMNTNTHEHFASKIKTKIEIKFKHLI